MFKEYDAGLAVLMKKNNSKNEWQKIWDYHKRMIKRIQHERLIHLLVTIFVGIVMMTASLVTTIYQSLFFAVLALPLILLFLAYLLHYRFLENTTQKWYLVEEEIINKMNL